MTPEADALVRLLMAAIASTSDPLRKDGYQDDARIVAAALPPVRVPTPDLAAYIQGLPKER